jgi:hypothetical protein
MFIRKVCNKRPHGRTVVCNQIQSEMCKPVSQRHHASTGYLYGFLRRYNLSSTMCTTAISKVNSDIQYHSAEKKRSSYSYVKEIALSHKVGCMWHMDKTPLYFDMPFKGTIDTKGRRRIPYLNTEKERKRVYVVLSVSEYGHKLHPMLVVKRQ